MKNKNVSSDLLKIILVLTGVEYSIMLLLSNMRQWEYIWTSVVLDASMLTMISTTALYFWLIKPTMKRLVATLDESRKSQKTTLVQLSIVVLKIGLIIFLVEVVIMLLLIAMVDYSSRYGSIIDALTVSMISTPLIYIWVIKPLYSHSEEFLEYNTKSKLQQIVKRFILLFLPSFLIFVIAVIATQRLNMNAKIENVIDAERLNITKQKDIIVNNLTDIFSDLIFLANQQDLTRIQDSISMTGRRFLGIDFKVFLESKLVYDQIRYINPQGREMVRANFNRGAPYVVPSDQLQSKKHRYYFREIEGWQKDEVFISPLDLNVEYGEIEIPRKPVIRFGTPVVNASGQNRGVLILSYLGNTLINKLTASSSKRKSEFMLLNSEGYWLIGPNPEDEWTFMYDHKMNHSFKNLHPQAWEKISRSKSGHFLNDGGMYTYETFHPNELLDLTDKGSTDWSLSFLTHINSDDLSWKIVSHISPEILQGLSRNAFQQLQLFYVLIFLFLVTGSWTLAYVLTTRKMSQEALVASENNYRKIIDESISTIFTTNAVGQLTYVNPSAKGLTGFSAEELFDKTFTELIREDWQAKVQQFYYQQFKERKLETALEFPIITKSGEEKWVEQLASLLIDDEKRAIGFQSIVYDVSERKKVEKELFMAKQLAEEASQLKSEFLANMSHELRTPLNSVIGFSNVLLKKNEKILDEKDKNYLHRILANGKHLLELINSVLDLSKIEAGRIELEVVDISLNNLITDIITQLEGQVQDKEFKLISNLPKDIATIQADPGKLKQVILNLLSNAIKFTSEGSVTISVQTDEGTKRPTRISVLDTGIGIPEDRLESVFEEFQQVDSSTARKYGGTGLGLAISKSLCELMGYELKVESQVGVGSEFTIMLNEPELGPGPTQAWKEKRKSSRSRKSGPTPGTLNEKRVLVIDDNRDSRILIETTLKEEGCHVIQAEQGFKGFDLALQEQPDLIILDLKMKETPGQEVLARLKANPDTKNIPVIIVSIVAFENKATLVEATDFVQKPINREALVWAVSRHINPRQ
ncbi:MAG: PAS domain S-box protein [Candidatus Marinimicrobia bacterium]|nr:PAS domain S-box protein [FCB group bacterium]MBL7026428.1 PAS domain S-box protein [Candidatus Neomarinimicrobiota bacterium]